MTWTSLLEILKYTVPAAIVFLTAYFLIKSFLDKEYKRQYLQLRFSDHKAALPIRLQAYERLVLFLERISPNNLIPRLQKRGMTVRDLQLSMLSSIRSEYEHNLSQQLYVSPQAWKLISHVKEEVIHVINNTAIRLEKDAPASQLSKGIFGYYISKEQAMPTQKAIDRLKMEIREIYK